MLRLAVAASDVTAAAGLLFDLHSEDAKRLALTHGVDREHFTSWARCRFSFYVVAIGGLDCGVIAIGSRRIHVAVAAEARGRWLRDLERVLRHHMGDDDAFLAVVDATDTNANSFVERCGCALIDGDEHVNRYSIELKNLWFNRRQHHGRNR